MYRRGTVSFGNRHRCTGIAVSMTLGLLGLDLRSGWACPWATFQRPAAVTGRITPGVFLRSCDLAFQAWWSLRCWLFSSHSNAIALPVALWDRRDMQFSPRWPWGCISPGALPVMREGLLNTMQFRIHYDRTRQGSERNAVSASRCAPGHSASGFVSGPLLADL